MNKDIENIKEQLEEVVKKNLPEKKQESFYWGKEDGNVANFANIAFNQALSQINTELITNKILEVVKKEIYDCMCEHNEARHGDKPDDAYDRVLDLFKDYE